MAKKMLQNRKADDELNQLQIENKKLVLELGHTKKRYQSVLSDLEKERQDIITLRDQINDLGEINGQQSEYCSRMGAASCTLLWRLSQRDDCVETMVAGTQTDEFLQLVCHTLESYTATVSEPDSQPYDDTSCELQFILSLCGVATNIAASDYGREFLMTNTNGTALIDTLMNTLKHLPADKQQETKIRNLCLKSLYNVSINQRGLKHLSFKEGLISSLTWIIEEDNTMENRLLAVRLIQSLILEPENLALIQKVIELLPADKIRTIAVNVRGELQEALLELLGDVKVFEREP